jgi:hypothetical protein
MIPAIGISIREVYSDLQMVAIHISTVLSLSEDFRIYPHASIFVGDVNPDFSRSPTVFYAFYDGPLHKVRA